MSQVPSLDYIQTGGKVDVYLAFPRAVFTNTNYWPFSPVRTGTPTTPAGNYESYTTLLKLGELADMVEPRTRDILHKVPGDRNGGNEGDPIEQQLLGQTSEFELAMSRWDPDVHKMLQSKGGLLTVPGKIPLATVGGLLHRDRGFRCLLFANRNYAMSLNFPCCLLEQDYSVGISTKFSMLKLKVAAHRAPEGYWGTQVTVTADIGGATDLVTGVVSNGDTTGINFTSGVYVPN